LKIGLYIAFFFVILIAASGNLFSEKDTIAVIKVKNVEYLSDYQVVFDLYITRITNDWVAFANSTFQLSFIDTNFKYNAADVQVALLKSDLPLDVQPGSALPTEYYLIEPKVFPNRISITIVGPEKFEDCIKVPLNSEVLLGTFNLSVGGNKILPKDLLWLNPIYWYQACAYKLEQDSLIENTIPFYYKNDNINMDDGKNLTFSLQYEHNPESRFIFDDFWVFYTGQTVDSLGWSTRVEKDVLGFTVKRGVKTSIFEIEYKDIIGTWRSGDPKFNPGYIGKGDTKIGNLYDPFYDTVQYRGGQYCYVLYASIKKLDGSIIDTLLAERCVDVPNAVISKAHPLKNPFSVSTTIELHLDDDCYVEGFVTDEIGKFVSYLTSNVYGVMKKTFMKKGVYYIDFNASAVASQGLYNTIFIAYPIKDPNIEVSKAVVKLQLIKDGSE